MLVDDMTNEDYHALKAISSSAVKTIHAKSLLHWKTAVFKENPAFALGTAVHALLLEPEKDLVVCGPETRRGSAWTDAKELAEAEGKTLLVKSDYDTCVAMAESVLRNSNAASLLQDSCGITEVSIFNKDPETGLKLKARPDLFIPEQGIILDVKTTKDASPKNGGFERQFFSLGYHVQAAFYKHVLELDGYPIEEFIFLAVEKEPPYAVQMHYLHKEVLEFGLVQVKEVLEQIKNVEDRGIDDTGWPSRNLILLPKWMKATNRIDDMTDYTITGVEALWPRINRTYKFDQAEKRSVPCDAFDDGAAYNIQFRMTKEQAKELFTEMAKAYLEAREDSWPDKIEIPFKRDEDTGTFTGKATIKGAYGKEATKKPMQVDAQGNKLPEDFLLTTGSTVNIAIAFFPYNMRDAGVSLRLRAVQVIKYAELEERNPFSAVEGYVHDRDDNPFKPEPLIEESEVTEESPPPLTVVKSKARAKSKAEPTKVDDELASIIGSFD